MAPRSLLCLAAIAATVACQGEERRAEPSAVTAAPPEVAPEPAEGDRQRRPGDVPPEPPLVPEGPATVVGSELSTDVILEHLARAPARRYRPVGRGELVFEVVLDAPVDALWNPESEDDASGWRRELAAWRVARCIGLDQVMPAKRRDVSPEELRERLDPAFADVWEELEERIRWDADGRARGAAVLLLRDVRPSGLAGRRLERWRRHLRQGVAADEARRRIHADLADLLLFDYLVAHPHRGAPVALRGLERLVFRDHRRAFAADAEALRQDMLGVEKLTRPWAEGLPRCDDGVLSAVLRDGEGGHLLAGDELSALVDRRRALASHGAALVDAHGREEVVVLP